LASGLEPEISVTVSSRNAAGLAETVDWVLERDLPFSLNFYREHGKSNCQSDLHLDDDRIIDGMLAAYKVIEGNLPNRSMLASLADRANLSGPHLRTCSAGKATWPLIRKAVLLNVKWIWPIQSRIIMILILWLPVAPAILDYVTPS
jgi:hypothetical protein